MHSWIICVLFSGIVNFHVKFKIIVDVVSCGGDASNHCFTTRGSFRYYGFTRLYTYIHVQNMCVCVFGYTHTTMFTYGTGTQFPGGKFACTLRNQACTFLYNLAHVACPTSRVTIRSISILRTTHTWSRTSLYVEILRQRSRNISP